MAKIQGEKIVETAVEARGAERGPTVRNVLGLVGPASLRPLYMSLADARAGNPPPETALRLVRRRGPDWPY